MVRVTALANIEKNTRYRSQLLSIRAEAWEGARRIAMTHVRVVTCHRACRPTSASGSASCSARRAGPLRAQEARGSVAS